MLPSTLKNFNVYANGFSYAGVASEVVLPKLTTKTESYRGGGMLAEVDIDMGLEKLEMESKYGGMAVGIMRQFGVARADGAQLTFVGAYQTDTTGAVMAAELVVRGRHTEIDPGTAKAGEKTETSVKSMLTYLKWTVNGRVEVEIDVFANIFIVDGVDRMQAIRLALGDF